MQSATREGCGSGQPQNHPGQSDQDSPYLPKANTNTNHKQSKNLMVNDGLGDRFITQDNPTKIAHTCQKQTQTRTTTIDHGE